MAETDPYVLVWNEYLDLFWDHCAYKTDEEINSFCTAVENFDIRTGSWVLQALVKCAQTRKGHKIRCTVATRVCLWLSMRPRLNVEEGCRKYVDRQLWREGKAEAYLQGIVRGIGKDVEVMRREGRYMDRKLSPSVPKNSKQASLW